MTEKHPLHNSLVRRNMVEGPKVRTLESVHRRLLELEEKRAVLIKRHKEWFSIAPKEIMGSVSIHRYGGHPLIRTAVLNVNHSEGTVFTEYLETNLKDTTFYRCLRDSELPLYMNQDISKYESQILKERFKGTRTEIPIRQDLMDEFMVMSRKFDRLYRLRGLYQKILTDYVTDNIPKGYPQYLLTELVTLDICGHTYYFKVGNNEYDIKIVHSVTHLKGA